MKRIFLVLAGLLLVGTQAYAGNGDLTVSGSLGVGTLTPGYKLDVNGDLNVSGIRLGNPRLGLLGYSGGDYGSVGYGYVPTTSSGIYNYGVNDTASQLRFTSGGFEFRSAAAGTTGNQITWTTPLLIDSTGNATFSKGVYTNDWLRINTSGNGLYSQANGNHIYSDNGNYWKMTGAGNTSGGLVFYQGYKSNLRGYVYWDTASFGLLDNTGNWALRIGDGRTSMTSYGALSIYGAKNGWSGISFPGNGTLMMHPSYSGFYNAADNNWRWYVNDSGTEYVYGDINFQKANPYINASSYTIMPGGLYVSGGTLYTTNAIQARGGLHNDTGAYLELNGGTSGKTHLNGNLVFPDGTEQSTAAKGGVPGYEVKTNSVSIYSGMTIVDVYCSSGKYALGGGYGIDTGTDLSVQVNSSRPIGNPATGWHIVTVASGAAPLTAYVICTSPN